jgi:hypothetical protein
LNIYGTFQVRKFGYTSNWTVCKHEANHRYRNEQQANNKHVSIVGECGQINSIDQSVPNPPVTRGISSWEERPRMF